MNLLVDIGNSRIKWCLDEHGILEAGQPIDHKQTDYIHDIQQSWLKLDFPKILAISSVTANQKVQQLTQIAKKLWPDVEVVIAKSSRKACSVTNAYKQAEKLGVDRWLGLIALQNFYPGNSCIVDCGTAITIDCLDENGVHLGGLISPGVQLMKQSLYQGTEDLTFINQNYSVGLSNFTGSAIYTGTLYAAAGLIEKAIKQLCACQTIVLTGGDAELLAQYLNFESIVEPNFVLKGLSLYCKRGSLS